MKITTTRFLILMAVLATFGPVFAGSLDPPGPPAPTMVTLQQIYNRQHQVIQSDTCFDNSGTNRFVDCGTTSLGTSNGTVKDMQTGLIWLKDANCFGFAIWADANIKAAALASGQCGLADGSKAGDWRLPTKDEWTAIFKASCYPSPGGPTLPDKVGTGCYATGTPWATGVQSLYYWSSSTYADLPGYAGYAWYVDLGFGGVGASVKSNPYYVWPVRGGQ